MNPRESALSRPVAMRLAATEYDRCAELFRSLSPAEWAMATDCPAWNIRQMAASIRENVRQQRKAARMAGTGGVYLDAPTARPGPWTPSASAGPSPGARPASRSTS